MTHHPDCDGSMTEHGATVVGVGNGFVLDAVDGRRLPGFFDRIGAAEAAARRFDRLVDCDGRCTGWEA